jgi:prefoldin subunit 5
MDALPLQAPPSMNGNPTMDLLNQAHSQLRTRKQTIEAELGRLDDLKKELQIIDAQMESLDKTLGVFQRRPAPER